MNGYTRKQEIVNGMTAGIGLLFGISGLPVLFGQAIVHQNLPGLVGAGIYSFCFLMLFTSSTVYHFVQEPVLKNLFKILDHISIYFLIAGTYTPFLLVYMNNTFGITLLCVLWGLTLIGIVFKARYTGRFDLISTLVYVFMGWIMVVGGKRFFEDLPLGVLVFIGIGGGLYSIGVFFYLWDKRTYTHAAWHAFVFAGAVSHYVAVLLAM